MKALKIRRVKILRGDAVVSAAAMVVVMVVVVIMMVVEYMKLVVVH